MKIKSAVKYGHEGWVLDNDRIGLFIMKGGGHIAGLELRDAPGVNPFWIPPWKGIEPGKYTRNMDARYGEKLLACIAGHNLCLGAFGSPSESERAAGLGCHGEAPVAEWRAIKKYAGAARLVFACACRLPGARMNFARTITMRRGSALIRVDESLSSESPVDMPFTMCQHVTFGPPFLEPGVTVFDMPATFGAVFPGKFSDRQRLRSEAGFKWPFAPGRRAAKVDLRRQGEKPHSDFSAQLIAPKSGKAWFTATNPKLGLTIRYEWKRSDWPWLGIWDENKARRAPPWLGKTVARGMEFANAPFPEGLRAAVTRGSLHGTPAFQWLPALGRRDFRYFISAARATNAGKHE